MILFFLLCLMSHDINGVLHHWLKISNNRTLIKDLDHLYHISIHVDQNSSQASQSKEESQLAIFIDDKNNTLKIGDGNEWNENIETRLGNDEQTNSHDADDESNSNNNIMILVSEMANQIIFDRLDEKIDCNKSYGICQEHSHYPNSSFDGELNVYRFLEVNETQEIIDIENRFGDTDVPLCLSMKQYIRPKTALNEYDAVSFVFNSDDFVQIIEIEICNEENTPCEFSESFPPGYRSYCKQKYVHRKLLGINSSKKLEPQIFKIPAGCCCEVKFLDDDF